MEEALTAEAIAAFQKRAEQVTRQLGRSGYRLVQMNINSSGPPVRPMLMKASVAAMDAASAPPAIEAGSQTIRVSISGTVELQLQ